MLNKKKKLNDEFCVVVYKNDLLSDISKILVPDRLPDIQEFVFVLHKDAVEEHYHVYLKFYYGVSETKVKDIFYNSKCFVSNLDENETVLSTLYYFTDGFRLPFESNYSIRAEERKRLNK